MATKKLDKLKTAGAEMDKFFSGAAERSHEVFETITEGKPARKPQKKVFSFRSSVDQVDSWRVWADAKGMKVDELGEKAMNEYIKRHSLTEDQQKIYELKLAQKKS